MNQIITDFESLGNNSKDPDFEPEKPNVDVNVLGDEIISDVLDGGIYSTKNNENGNKHFEFGANTA